MSLPIFEFLIDDTEESGVKTISLVSSPAMKSDFLVFDEQKPKPKYIFLKKDDEEYKGIVAGLSLIPDKLIYRVDEETGDEYLGYFSADTVENIRNKYHKEVQNLKSVNLEHVSSDTVDAYLVESYLLDTQDRVDEVLAKGIEEAVLGAWYTAFKIDDEDVFNEVLAGDFKGFSVEAFLNRELRAIEMSKQNNNFKDKTKKMKKNLIERLRERVNTVLSEVNFEDMLVPELNVVATWGNVGEVVTKTYEDEEGNEVVENIGEGSFVVEDGRTLVVDADSMLVEVTESVVEETPEEETEAVVEEETEVKAEETSVEEEKSEAAEIVEEVKAEEEVVAEETEAAEEGMPDAVKSWLTSIAGDFDDGEIYVSFMKTGGELTYGSVSTYANIKMSEERDAEKQALEEKVKELETKLSEPIAEPVLKEKKEVQGEAKELTLYERVATRKGLPIV